MTKPERISWLKTCTRKQRSDYYNAIASIGCIICGKPAEIHHGYGHQFPAKREHRPCMPLCFDHHSAQGLDGIHGGKESFEQKWDTQDELLIKTERLLQWEKQADVKDVWANLKQS